MLLTTRNRANTKHAVGPGGSRCPCCAESPRNNKAVRRSLRRIEKATWKKEEA